MPLVSFYTHAVCYFVLLFVVGEEDELSIKEAAELVVEGMQFTGKVEVSFQCTAAIPGVARGSLLAETAETNEGLLEVFLSA